MEITIVYDIHTVHILTINISPASLGVLFLWPKSPWEWHSVSETCSSLILVVNFILITAFVVSRLFYFISFPVVSSSACHSMLCDLPIHEVLLSDRRNTSESLSMVYRL